MPAKHLNAYNLQITPWKCQRMGRRVPRIGLLHVSSAGYRRDRSHRKQRADCDRRIALGPMGRPSDILQVSAVANGQDQPARYLPGTLICIGLTVIRLPCILLFNLVLISDIGKCDPQSARYKCQRFSSTIHALPSDSRVSAEGQACAADQDCLSPMELFRRKEHR
jgi:hypothetical protein